MMQVAEYFAVTTDPTSKNVLEPQSVYTIPLGSAKPQDVYGEVGATTGSVLVTVPGGNARVVHKELVFPGEADVTTWDAPYGVSEKSSGVGVYKAPAFGGKTLVITAAAAGTMALLRSYLMIWLKEDGVSFFNSPTQQSSLFPEQPRHRQLIAPEARERLQEREQVVGIIRALATQEAEVRGLPLYTITIRPAWSHESDEQKGVVIDVEVKATAEERFAYWDAICERVNQLEAALSVEQQCVLNDDISIIVSRS